MKAAATPKAMVSSSPGRPEKLPAPGLARILLLRGKSKSRSKSRARSGPIFVSRSRSVGGRSSGPTEEDEEGAGRESGRGEPSSPKVTCIGQVRIRNRNRNKNKNKTKIKNKNLTSSSSSSSSSALLVLRCHCCCCCNICPRQQQQQQKKKKIDTGRPYRFFSWRRKKAKQDPSPPAAHVPPIAFVREVKIRSESESESDRDGKSTSAESEDDETKVFVTSSSSPPKNALLLMRCRSAPHNRSSALATCRFVVSPVEASESGEGEGEEVVVLEEKRREVESEEATDLPPAAAAAAGVAVSLMRCNSEPAKKGEKLMEVSYGKWNGSGSGSGSGSREQGGGLGMDGQEERHSPPSILSP